MAERRGTWAPEEDELPVYLARPGSADQLPRQKHGGLFCSVEDAFDCKTIDFDALSVGQRGSRTPRTAKRERREAAGSPAGAGAHTPRGSDPGRAGLQARAGQDAAREPGGQEVREAGSSAGTLRQAAAAAAAAAAACFCFCLVWFCLRVEWPLQRC